MEQGDTEVFSGPEIEYLFHHVFLPPQLPQADDSDKQGLLFDVTVQALEAFADLLPASSRSIVDQVLAGFCSARSVHGASGNVTSESAVLAALKNLSVPLPIHVQAQNAGVIISKSEDCAIIIEEFELAPQNSAVNGNKGRLIRRFPGLAVSIQEDVFNQPGFLEMIAQTLVTLCHQPAPGMQPQTSKTGQMQDETRDTTHPGMISEYFMNLIKPAGEALDTPAISKNTRDEVLWQNAKLPWRRSPLWLLIRVTLQLFFHRSSLPWLYKHFMVFLMSYILRSENCVQLPSDSIFAMNAKIARRLLKLQREGASNIHGEVEMSIREALTESSEWLSDQWRRMQQEDDNKLDLQSLESLQFQDDIRLSIPELDTYLTQLERRPAPLSTNKFVPTPQIVVFKADELPRLSAVDNLDRPYEIAKLEALESWTSLNLDTWLSAHHNEQACLDVANLLQNYYSRASRHYAKNPEALSIMVLTVYELWVALDKVTIIICPLLAQYAPGISWRVLENLLLPFKHQMFRLDVVEKYLRARCSRPGLKQNTLLYDSSSDESFAAQYFDQSPKHIELHSTIIIKAEESKARKVRELKDLKRERAKLSQLVDTGSCQTEQVYDPETEKTHTRCISNCRRCSNIEKLEALSIETFEWPLPADTNRAKIVVFELQVPRTHAAWRESTYFVLQTVLKASQTGRQPRASYRLANDVHLASEYFIVAASPQRVGLLSEDKPHKRTHYSGKHIGSIVEAQVCVPNESFYRYFDTVQFIESFAFNDETTTACTYKPSRQALQRFLFRPARSPDGPGPNTVIASQHDCPKDMNLQEFKELCSLPLGHRIQWENIMLQLKMPAVDFKKVDTTLFIQQCLYQAGPASDNVARSAHQSVVEDSFARDLLEILKIALERIKDNWESAQAIRVFSAIAARILTLAITIEIEIECLTFLRHVRVIVMSWMSLLRSKGQRAENPTSRTLFAGKNLELALICAITFDLDETHLQQVLNSTDCASILIQCSIVIQEGHRSHPAKSNGLLSMRWTRILARCRDLIVKHQAALDHAINIAWSGYSKGSPWQAISAQCPEWVTCMTSGVGLHVHYNVLTGELLVNGLPLDRPPKHYEGHDLYRTLFGTHAVEVMPTSIRGMQFSTKNMFESYEVHLGMAVASSNNESELIVQPISNESTWETIPKRLLRDQYPPHFIDDFVHWYDFASDTVQFRSKQQPWDATSSAIWTLSRSADDSKWQLAKDGASLIGLLSKTSLAVTKVCRSLSNPTQIHILLNAARDVIDIDIPQLKIAFGLTQGSTIVWSKQFRGMQIDPDQSIGTLCGLRSKMLLKHDKLGSRQILLPEAQVLYSKVTAQPPRISVQMALDSATSLHVLDVDDTLGRLVDRGSVHGKIFLAYLHALTTYCLPDMLTGKTGTEQALAILSSAAVRSFQQLAEADVDILTKLAGLTPTRNFYPAHLRQMQTITWNRKLGFLAQHGGFFEIVSSLLEQANSTRILYPAQSFDLPEVEIGDITLHERDLIQSSTFRVAGYGAERFVDTHDVQYVARDHDQVLDRAQNVYCLSQMVYSGISHRHWSAQSGGYLWRSMSRLNLVDTWQERLDMTVLKYDRAFTFEDEASEVKAKFVLEHWPALHKLLANRQQAQNHKYSLMAWITSMAWGQIIDLDVLQAFALMVTTESVSEIEYPAHLPVLTPKAGKELSLDQLRDILDQFCYKLERRPESRLERLANESQGDFYRRKQKTNSDNLRSVVKVFARKLLVQWPTRSPITPDVVQPINARRYIDVEVAMRLVRQTFERCYDTKTFFEYLTQVEAAIASLECCTIENDILLQQVVPKVDHMRGYVSTGDLFELPAPLISAPIHTQLSSPSNQVMTEQPAKNKKPRLAGLIKKLKAKIRLSKYEFEYVSELCDSLNNLQAHHQPLLNDCRYSQDDLAAYKEACEARVETIYDDIVSAISPGEEESSNLPLSVEAHMVKQWPRISPLLLLEHLARKRFVELPPEWQECLVQYGLALTELQKAQRLYKAASLDIIADVLAELRNIGHQNWDPMSYSDSLLMEVENGMLIRKVQEDIAAQMRDPPRDQNAVMQLNMGEGKSSVIVPMIAAALADSSKLVRVVVAKPQSKQMAQMLISKLGGMLDRQIYYMPFSRSLRLDETRAMAVTTMLQDCMSNGGILLVQP